MEFFTCYFLLFLSIVIVHCQSSPSCSCNLDATGMTMICSNVQSLLAYQQCLHEQLNVQSDLKLRRGGVITNLTIMHHQLRSVSSGLFQFSLGNNHVYQLNDLRYLSIVNGTLRQIENGALESIERALEHLDFSKNELQHMPRNEKGQYNNLIKLVLSNNQIHRVTVDDIRAYKRLQQLDLSFNRLQYVDMLLVDHLKNLRQLFLNSNMLRTLIHNVTFPNNFHLKLASNPLECDCRLRWLRNALNRVEYPIYNDEPQCEMPKALADKKIVTLRDEQFVCGPIISKPDSTVLTVTTGEIATLRCDVYSDPAPEVWWTFQNKIIGKMISAVSGPDIHAGSYTIRYSCLSSSESSSSICLNKTTTLTISNIGSEHNGTYNCVAAIRNQGRSDNEYLAYELRVRRSSPLTDSSFLVWTIGIFLFLFIVLLLLLCSCWLIRCHRMNRQQAERNKALLFDANNHHYHQNGSLLANGNMYKEKNEEQHSFVTNGSYDPYDMIDSRSQLGPPMYSEVRMVDSTPLRSVGGGSMSSSIPLHDTATLMRRNHPHDSFYDSYRSDRQLYEQIYRPSPMEPVIVDEFEDEMIFPTGYEEDYEYREDIMKPNQAVDPRRQPKQQPTNHDRSGGTIVLPPPVAPITVNGNHTSHQKLILTPNSKPSDQILKSSSFDSDYKFDRSESQYAGLVESQL